MNPTSPRPETQLKGLVLGRIPTPLLALVALGLMSAQLQADNRILCVPFKSNIYQDQQFPGLAYALAFNDLAEGHNQVFSFTAYRKRLAELGIGPGAAVSLAGMIRIAEEFQVDRLVFGEMTDTQTILKVLYLPGHRIDTFYLQPFEPESFSQLMDASLGLLGLKARELNPRMFDIYNIWASAYYIEDLDTSKTVYTRLLEQPWTGHLLLQEYADIFGEPHLHDTEEIERWRNIYTLKSNHTKALELSQKLLEQRNEPGDYLAHASILMTLEDPEMCTYVDKVVDSGLDLSEWLDVIRQCHPNYGRAKLMTEKN